MSYVLAFFAELRCTKLYQKNKYDRLSAPHERKSHLMLRPCFPPHYSESQVVNLHNISGVIAIVVDEWKVGDLVDWWYEGCYWSGRITCLLGSDKVQVKCWILLFILNFELQTWTLHNLMSLYSLASVNSLQCDILSNKCFIIIIFLWKIYKLVL